MLKQWTPREDAELKRLWAVFPPNVVAKMMKRGENSVRQRARKLKIAKTVKKVPMPNKEEDGAQRALNQVRKFHLNRIASMSCAVMNEDCSGRIECHHIRKGSEARNHEMVIPLCSFHHRDNKNGYHGMSREKFDARYKIDARKTARKLWAATVLAYSGEVEAG